jgi:hypothetical protein
VTSFEYEIKNWIIDRLSVNLIQFNDLPACPFAKEALTQNKVIINELTNQFSSRLSMKEYFIAELENFSYHWPKGKEVIVLGCLPEYISSNELSEAVEESAERFLKDRGYIALEDHPADFEEVDGYNLNQGTYALILLQEAEKLNKARTILEKKDYYKNWEPKYKQEVLSRS